MLQLHLSYQQFYCLLRRDLYQRFYGILNIFSTNFYWRAIVCDVIQGPISISDKTSCRKILWSLEAARLAVEIITSLWNVTGNSVALLPRCLSNFRAIVQFQIQILQLQDFARSYNKMSYRILKWAPGYLARTWWDVTPFLIKYTQEFPFEQIQQKCEKKLIFSWGKKENGYYPGMLISMAHLPVGGVAFISFVISVDNNIVYGGLSSELNINQMWLWAIRLPVGLQRAITQLVYTKTWNE